jgi:hypothetical protein
MKMDDSAADDARKRAMLLWKIFGKVRLGS